jgi:hypothetical protein
MKNPAGLHRPGSNRFQLAACSAHFDGANPPNVTVPEALTADAANRFGINGGGRYDDRGGRHAVRVGDRRAEQGATDDAGGDGATNNATAAAGICFARDRHSDKGYGRGRSQSSKGLFHHVLLEERSARADPGAG